MTKLLHDILREPAELAGILSRFSESRWEGILAAAGLVRSASLIYVVGIGSSWNAGWAVTALLQKYGFAAHPADASELLHFGTLAAGAVAIVLSRSGRSVEIVRLASRFAEAGVPVVAITNTADTPLTRAARVVLQMGARFDHLVSVTMYSGLALTGGLVASAAARADLDGLALELQDGLARAEAELEGWRKQLAESVWLDPTAATYFLARGGTLASACEARLLWEEAAKRPACAIGTGTFRHGTQEMVFPGTRIGMWIDPLRLRCEDLMLAGNLAGAGAQVLLIGRDLPAHAAHLAFEVPRLPADWEFLTGTIPAQLAAERLAALGGVDCDAFRLCPYIIDSEGGLAPGKTEAGGF